MNVLSLAESTDLMVKKSASGEKSKTKRSVEQGIPKAKENWVKYWSTNPFYR